LSAHFLGEILSEWSTFPADVPAISWEKNHGFY
jgi:hypothetical protein